MAFRALTTSFIEEIEDDEQLKEIFVNALERIKKEGLFEKLTGERYQQDTVAKIWGVTYRDISNARNHPEAIGKKGYLKLFDILCKDYHLMVNEKNEVISGNTPEEDPIKELAGKLALNLIDVSTSFDETIDDYDKILDNTALVHQRQGVEDVVRERYIAVVGAGASHASTLGKNSIPTSKEAIAKLFDAFKGQVDSDLIKAEVKRLNRFNRSKEEDFETHLLAFHKFGPEITEEKLMELCGNANTPCLPYEVLAHMLKHRFLDAIINFNYDELLDSAIAEELPNSNDYRFIYTAGHCPAELEELQIDNRIKQPIYIKCHGTISQPNSLRFTQGNAYLIEEAIQKHIIDLFAGDFPTEAYKGKLALNLLVIGFGMQNHTFNQIIEEVVINKGQTVKIWLFDTDPNLGLEIKKKFRHLTSEQWARIEVVTIPLQNEHSLEKELVRLWNQIDKEFKKPYKPQGIVRHEFISYIFKHISPLDIGPGAEKMMDRKAYYLDRLYIELFILILKSNGIIHLSQISDGRVGKYLELLYKEKDTTSIHDYLKNIGMKVYEGFMYDTYLIGDDAFGNTSKIIKILKHKLGNGDLLSRNTRSALKKNTKIFQQYCDGILMRRLLKVNPKYFHKHDHLFSHLTEREVMSTSFSWIYNYRRNIETKLDEWHVMLTTTEEGGFLYGDITSGVFKDKYFEIILATYGTAGSTPRTPRKLHPLQLLSEGLKYRPWWLHNKHLVLLLKRKDTSFTGKWENDWELVEGYFYRHTMLSQRVNPVKIIHPRDLKRLLYVFAIYWHGAELDPEKFSNKDANMNIVATGGQIEEIINDLLKPYEEKRKQKE